MKPLKSKVSVSLDDDIIRLTKELAEIDDRTFSSYINLILRKNIQDYIAENTDYEQPEKVDFADVAFLEKEEP